MKKLLVSCVVASIGCADTEQLSSTTQAVQTLPVRIQAEDYDAYFDTTAGNFGARYRFNDVDISNVFPDDGTPEVGWITASEWLQYSVQVTQPAYYVLRLRVAQYGTGASLHVAIDGTCSTQTIANIPVPGTTTYRHWITMPVGMVLLGAGTHTVRLCFDQTGGEMNLNWLELVPRPMSVPGRIEAEDFELGEGVGYHDTDPGNWGMRYRTSESVEITDAFVDADTMTFSIPAVATEYLKYEFGVQQAGNYVFKVRLTQPAAGAAFHLEVDGANVSGSVPVPATGAQSKWVTIPVATRNLTAGLHSMRVVMDTNASNNVVMWLNWIEVARESQVAFENTTHTGTATWRDQGDITYDYVFDPDGGGPQPSQIYLSKIKGYPSGWSVNKGAVQTLYIDNDEPAGPLTVDIYRLGDYAGTYARLMRTVSIAPQNQPACVFAPANAPYADLAQVECNWSPSYEFVVPTDWVSGLYLAKVHGPTATGQAGNYIPFVVRDDARKADILYVQPMTTYQAYNDFPYGYSLYSEGALVNVRVSLKRPLFGNGAPGRGATEVLRHEMNAVAFLERRGYDVAYASSLDFHRMSVAQLASYRAIIFGSHDEYWSSTMRANAEELRDRGVSLAFFGSNSAYWQIRFENSNNTIVCYRTRVRGIEDPMPHPSQKTTLFRDVGRPEQWLLGLQYAVAYGMNDPNPNEPNCCADNYWNLEGLAGSAWPFAGSATLITNTTRIDDIVGHEVDSYDPRAGMPTFMFEGTTYSNQPDPARVDITQSGYTLLATSGFWNLGMFGNCPEQPWLLAANTRLALCGKDGTQNSSVYRAPSGAYVFASGTIGWPLALANVDGSVPENDVVKTATANILNQFLAGQINTPPVNQFAGATAVAKTWYETTFWAPEGWLRGNVIDGRRSSQFGTSLGYTSAGAANALTEEWIYLQASSVRAFSKVVLYPNNDAGNIGAGFPVNFTIQVWDGANWITRVSHTNYPLPSTGQSFYFGATDVTDRIRIRATKLRAVGGLYYLQLAEIEVY